MRKLLLDTHIFLWWLNDDSRLTEKQRDLILTPRQTVLVSIVSLWEIVIKESIGKLKLPRKFNFQEAIEHNQFVLQPIEIQHIVQLRKLPMHHRDPFDRLLIAQAQAISAILLTDDSKIMQYAVETERHSKNAT